MKKIILLVFFSILISGCTNKKEETKPIPTSNIESSIIEKKLIFYPSSYIETIPENAKKFLPKDNTILKNITEIQEINKDIAKRTTIINDLENTKSLSKTTILNYIKKYTIPTMPKYDGSKKVTTSQINSIINNRNLDKVESKNTLQRGIIVKRANLRGFPTSIHFFDRSGVYNFDRMQECELLVNTEVIILHESKDKKWYFVMTYAYVGWVLKDNVALFKDTSDRDFFLNNENFLVVTAKSITINNNILDMSVKLPFSKVVKDGYEAVLPIKGEDGYVEKSYITLKRNESHIGYLDYTKRNVIIQAFKYEGTPYSWASLDKNVDCSGFVSNVFRTLGFMFPRNTRYQNYSIGKITSLSGKSGNEKLKTITGLDTSLLYQNGHVMLYLGKLNNKHYIIHAAASPYMKVVVTELNNNTSYLGNINKINVLY